MKKLLNLAAISAIGWTSILTMANLVSCQEANRMVKLYKLTPRGSNSGWEPAIHENNLIIEVDKTTIDKYTLEHHNLSSVHGSAKIIFYFKNETVNNFEDKYWSGPAKAYDSYFTKELGLKPTPYEQWMPVFGYKWQEVQPNDYWIKDYKSTESFGFNPQIINKVFLKQIDNWVQIEIEYFDNTVEERFQETGNPKDYKRQFEDDLKIDHRNIIIEE